MNKSFKGNNRVEKFYFDSYCKANELKNKVQGESEHFKTIINSLHEKLHAKTEGQTSSSISSSEARISPVRGSDNASEDVSLGIIERLRRMPRLCWAGTPISSIIHVKAGHAVSYVLSLHFLSTPSAPIGIEICVNRKQTATNIE